MGRGSKLSSRWIAIVYRESKFWGTNRFSYL